MSHDTSELRKALGSLEEWLARYSGRPKPPVDGPARAAMEQHVKLMRAEALRLREAIHRRDGPGA